MEERDEVVNRNRRGMEPYAGGVRDGGEDPAAESIFFMNHF